MIASHSPLLSPAKATARSDPPIGPEPRHFSHRIASIDPASDPYPSHHPRRKSDAVDGLGDGGAVDGSDAVGTVETKQRWCCIAIVVA
jgi:hypothetical protein